jgi:hypothetical protein
MLQKALFRTPVAKLSGNPRQQVQQVKMSDVQQLKEAATTPPVQRNLEVPTPSLAVCFILP